MNARHGLSLLASLGLGTIASQAHAQEPKFEYGKQEEVKKVEWKADAQAGLILTTGNSHTSSFAAGATVSRKAGDNKFTAEASAAYGKTDLDVYLDANGDGFISESEISTVESTAPNNYQGKLRYDRFLTEKNSLFVSGRAGADKAAGKELVAGGQLGYSRLIVKSEMHEVTGEFGYDFSYESYVAPGADPVNIHSGRVFLGYAGALSPDTGLTGAFELLTNVNEEKDAVNDELGGKGVDAFKDNRIIGKVGLNTKLSSSISFRFGFTVKYDQAPAPIAPSGVKFVGPGGLDAEGNPDPYTPLSEKTDTITDVALIVNFL